MPESAPSPPPEHDAQTGSPLRPPAAPRFQPRLLIDKAEAVGIPLLFSLPLLAMVGTFDQQEASQTDQAAGIQLNVSYPARTRLQLSGMLAIDIRNTGRQPREDLTLRIEQRYLRHFDQLRFLPADLQLDGQYYRAHLPPLAPGQTRRILLEVRPQRPGLHRGLIELHTAQRPLRAPISSLVFP